MKYPAKLKAGATVGLLSLCSQTTPEREKACIETLEKMGYKVKASDNISTNYGGYMAGSAETRGYWLNKMFADPEIDAIFCVRGGDGGNRVWKYIDLDVVRNNPKIFVGYSDVTTFHLAFNQLCDLVTFHGPMVSSNMVDNFDSETEVSFMEALNADEPYEFRNPEGFDIKVMRPGKAKGRLIGGNLTLAIASIGTPYEIDCRDKILLLEDVHGHVDSLDRFVMQLVNAGKFDDCAGVLLGQYTDLFNHVDEKYQVIEMFEDILSDYNKPVMYNIQTGHDYPMMTMPLGAMCEMDTETGKIVFYPER